MTPQKYAKELGYSAAEYYGKWKEYDVYTLLSDAVIADRERIQKEEYETEIPAVAANYGLPVFALKKDGAFRCATVEERDKICGW